MDSICRLCFKVSFDTLIELKNSETLHKLKAFTMLQINTHPALPNKICTTCKTSIDDFFIFHSRIVENDKILMTYLETGYETLNNFYDNIIGKQKVKHEFNNSWNKTEIKEKTINFNKTKTDNNLFPDEIKTENSLEPCNDKIVEYTSEDDLTLSAMKTLKTVSEIVNDEKIKANKLRNRKEEYSEPQSSETEIKEEPVLENSNTQKQFYKYAPNWKCLTCSDCFDNRNMLLSHYKMKHGCLNEVSDKSNIENNCTSSFVVNGEKYKCLKCDKIYDRKRLILRHMNSHIEDRPYICKLCGRTYKTASDIVRHGRAHDHVKILSCKFENCSYNTAYIGALRDHEKRHCDDYKYKCEKCGKGFQVKTWYEQHQNIHTGDRPFACHLCGRTFQMQRYLKTHVSTVHPQASEVKRHMCTVCGTCCDSRHALNIHLKTHGMAATYLCDTCGKSLSSTQHLRLHSRLHQGIKPHTCGTCGKSFTKKCNLQLHKRIHSGERPFICSYCGKAFTQKSTLHIHIRYHTGSRPYKCENCTKSFVCQGLLSSHQKGCP